MPQTDIVILKALLENQPGFVSGNLLANELGISRVGVWARLEKMRDMNFSFEAIRHRGYRLLQEPPTLNDRLVRAYLALYGNALDVSYLSEVDSTNSEAERLLAAGHRTPFAVLAATQTAGRGRLGRTWHSPNEGNLYASFAFRPQLPPMNMQTITLWLGLKVCEILNEEYQLPVRIKWPNDLLLEGKKVAGMLTEARIDTDRTRDLVFGLGMNVNGNIRNYPREIAGIATSLAAQKGEPLLINQVAARVCIAIIEGYNAFMEGAAKEDLVKLWNQYDCLCGRQVRGEFRGQPVDGEAAGIDSDGCLILKGSNGRTLHLSAGEVHLHTR